jgi:hypothetical protein
LIDQFARAATRTNGAELFGARSGDGFAELAALDGDGNGWIDEGDAAWQAWHDALMDLLEQAPEVAWSSDVLSCKACGYHYHVEHGCCESDGSDAMEEGVDNVPPVA